MLLEDGAARRRRNKRELVDVRPSNAARCKYPTPPCALAKILPKTTVRAYFRQIENASTITHFLLFQQIFFILVCIHPGTPRVPPRVWASGPKLCGGNYYYHFHHRHS